MIIIFFKPNKPKAQHCQKLELKIKGFNQICSFPKQLAPKMLTDQWEDFAFHPDLQLKLGAADSSGNMSQNYNPGSDL